MHKQHVSVNNGVLGVIEAYVDDDIVDEFARRMSSITLTSSAEDDNVVYEWVADMEHDGRIEGYVAKPAKVVGGRMVTLEHGRVGNEPRLITTAEVAPDVEEEVRAITSRCVHAHTADPEDTERWNNLVSQGKISVHDIRREGTYKPIAFALPANDPDKYDGFFVGEVHEVGYEDMCDTLRTITEMRKEALPGDHVRRIKYKVAVMMFAGDVHKNSEMKYVIGNMFFKTVPPYLTDGLVHEPMEVA